jgi:hypothetical protein
MFLHQTVEIQYSQQLLHQVVVVVEVGKPALLHQWTTEELEAAVGDQAVADQTLVTESTAAKEIMVGEELTGKDIRAVRALDLT